MQGESILCVSESPFSLAEDSERLSGGEIAGSVPEIWGIDEAQITNASCYNNQFGPSQQA